MVPYGVMVGMSGESWRHKSWFSRLSILIILPSTLFIFKFIIIFLYIYFVYLYIKKIFYYFLIIF